MGRHPSRRHVSPDEAPAGRRIRQRRRELGLTQADLAGPQYTKSFISQLESGSADPSLDTLRFLGRRLHLGLSTMAGDEADQRLSLLAGLLSWAEATAAARPDAARRAVEVACEIAGEAGADLYAADALLLLTDIEMRAGALDRAGMYLADAARRAMAPGPRLAARIDLAAGRLALRRGDPGAAVSAFLRAAGAARRSARHPDISAEALIGAAAALIARREIRQARRRLQSAASLSARHHLPSAHGRALIRLAFVDRLDGRAGALVTLQRADEILAGSADQHDRIDAMLGIGLLLLERGEVAEAARALGVARRLSGALGQRAREYEVTIAQARAAIAAGDLETAGRLASEARDLGDGARSPSMLARADAIAGRVLSAQGRHGEAADLLAAAIAALDAALVPQEVAEAAQAMSLSAQARGDPDAAARYLAMAHEGAQTRRPTAWVLDLA